MARFLGRLNNSYHGKGWFHNYIIEAGNWDNAYKELYQHLHDEVANIEDGSAYFDPDNAIAFLENGEHEKWIAGVWEVETLTDIQSHFPTLRYGQGLSAI